MAQEDGNASANAKLATENLFLLEFLVDNVTMGNKCDCDSPPGELCVSFQFLDNAPLDVCEADFTPNRKYGKGEENVKSGKSCLFSLTPAQVSRASELFDVYVSIFKRMQPGWLPEKINVGNALISIANLFVELLQSVETTNGESPSAKTLKDTFDISDSMGINVGKISIYVRMSCFGKLIVTQFQMNLDDKSVLFKDKEGQSLYRYKKAKKGGETKIEDMAKGRRVSTNYNAQCPQVSCFSGGEPKQPQRNPDCPSSPCPTNNQEGQFAMSQGQFNSSQGQFNSSQGQFPGGFDANSGCPIKSCFEDPNMFMQMQQNLTMFPPPGQSTIFPSPVPGQSLLPCSECNFMQMPPCIPPQQQQSQMGAPCNECGTINQPQQLQFFASQFNNVSSPCIECGAIPNAPCGQSATAPVAPPASQDPPGNYQEIGAKMGGNALTIRVHKDKNKIQQVDGDNNSICSACCCTPDNVGGGGKKSRQKSGGDCTCTPSGQTPAPVQSFQMRRSGVKQGDQTLPFSFKMSGCNPCPADNVVINPPVATKPDGTQYTEISDPNQEIFVLRIGKKSEGVQKKANLELELCTPRGPEIKPIPKKETRDAQYDPNDCGSGGKDKNGKKKEKGKGKGKGKGKKRK